MIEPIDTAPKDGTRILCLCADGRTQYCWWVGCNEAEGFWMTERETTPRAWYSNKRLPPEGPAVTPAADDPAPTATPGEQYHEGMGDVTWWRFPVEEPPWVGSPNDSDWPGYHTHFTPLPPVPVEPDPAPTADSPVATDEELEKVYETAGGAPFDFPDALRAVYDLGRLHESLHQRILNGRALQVAAEFAEEYRDDLKALADSDPAPTADGGKPLWVTAMMAMDSTPGRRRDAMGAALRVIGDWLEYYIGFGSKLPVRLLRAEAERAEAR